MFVSTSKVFLWVSLMASQIYAEIGDLSKDLKPQLSAKAEIYSTGSPEYANAITRWSASIKPGLDAIVKVTSEEDIRATVNFTPFTTLFP